MDMIARKKRLMMQGQRGLPSLYQPVDFIWGDGSQRIVTDVLPDDNDIWEVDYQLFDISENTGIFGCANGSNNFNCLGTNKDFNNYFAQIGSGNNYQQSGVAKDIIRHTHKVSLPDRKYIIDDVNETDLSSLTYAKSDYAYGLWFYNGGGTTYRRYTSGMVYHCSIKGRCDLYPCVRISDGAAGMFDVLHRKFYTNSGTDRLRSPTDLFYDCMDLENYWIATSVSNRVKRDGGANIAKNGNVIVLTRNDQRYGLNVAVGYLHRGKAYKISGTFSGTDGKAYIDRNEKTILLDEHMTHKRTTINFSNGSVTFAPTQDGIYELLVWQGGTGNMTAENVSIEEVA